MSGTKLTIYGGSREIGGNQILLEEDGHRLLFDFGTNFARTQEYYDEFLPTRVNGALRDLLRLGVLPEIDGIYRQDHFKPEGIEEVWPDPTFYTNSVRSYAQYVQDEGRPAVEGVLISHPHADHVQYVHHLHPHLPVVCLPVAKTVLEVIETVSSRKVELTKFKARFVERDSDKSTFPGAPSLGYRDPSPRTYLTPEPYQPFMLGPFQVTAIPVDHSVPGAAAFLVKTKKGRTVFYTGDLRFHGRRTDLTARLFDLTRNLQPDILMCEGTRVDSQSRDNEQGVEHSLSEIVGQTEGLCCVDFSWKDTDRFETMWRVAQAHGKKLVVSPELALLLRRLSEEHPGQFKPMEAYPGVSVHLRRMASLLYSPGDYSNKKTDLGYLADWKDAGTKGALKARDPDHPAMVHYYKGTRAPAIKARPKDYLLMLSYFEMNDLFDLDPPPNSYYLRAACSPFNVEMEMDMHKQRRWMERFGMRHNLADMRVCEGHEHRKGGLEGRLAHVSGHASGAELKPFIHDMAPRLLVPIHTENPEAFDGWAKDSTFAARAGVPFVVEF